MTHKRRFLMATVISALTWAVTLFYIFGYTVHTFATGNTVSQFLIYYGVENLPSGDWIALEPPRYMVMLVTLFAVAVSFAAWRWYTQSRVDRALSGLNAEEKYELRNRLAQDEKLTIQDDGEFEVVFSPRKRKSSEEES
jgi:hypothetical protein